MGELEADGAKGANPNARRDTAKLAEPNALRCIIMKRNSKNENLRGGMRPMKKFLSMVMAAAMVVSLVPATAFAAEGVTLKGTASITGAQSFTETTVNDKTVNDGKTKAEVQIKITDSAYTADARDHTKPALKFTVVLDNAKFKDANGATTQPVFNLNDANGAGWLSLQPTTDYTVNRVDDDEFEVTMVAGKYVIEKGDIISISLPTTLVKTGNGKSAKVTVESDDVTISGGTDLTYATVGQVGFTASVRKTTDIAVEEVNNIEDVTIKPAVGDKFGTSFISNKEEINVRVSGGVEFANAKSTDIALYVGTTKVAENTSKSATDELILKVIDATTFQNADKVTLEKVRLDAADAKEGAAVSLKIYVPRCDTVSVEVAKIIGSAVTMTVDADADVPVFYSSTDLDNTGITNYSEHKSLEVTIKESFAGAWNVAKDWTLTLPEGVYAVANANGNDIVKANETITLNGYATIEEWFEDAYIKGDYDNFTFKKRTWEVTDPTDKDKDDPTEFSFKLYLVADPNFEGDVTLKLEGEGVDTQTVTIAKFVKPYTVEASQNDLQIDYRNTEVGSNIVIKEAEAGLWKKDTKFEVSLEKIAFDSGATVTVDEKSGMEVKNVKTNNGVITFTVDKVSTDSPATITISDLDLYMDRSLPAGKYDLKVYSTTMLGSYDSTNKKWSDGYLGEQLLGEQKVIDDMTDRFYDTVVKEGFINIVTAGREDADSFTTKLVIPIGSTTMTAGETQVTMDAPAYISADGYTMLPLRAVAKALGIPNGSILWDGATKTVTVMYGSKVIVMTVGQKTMYLNGSPVPASAAPEITNERTFLPVRDLGTALGVSDLTWDTDPATGKVSTVYVNANK